MKYTWISKFSNLYEVKEDDMGRACSTNVEKRNAYKILVGKPEGKRPLGRPRRECIILKWILGWSGMDWIDLAQDRGQWTAIVNTVIKFRVP
jgi:hypothetical protein